MSKHLAGLAQTLGSMLKSLAPGAAAPVAGATKTPEQLEAEEAAAANAAAAATGTTPAALTGTLADGTPFQAVDGNKLIEDLQKSMTERMDAGHAETEQVLRQAVEVMSAQGAKIIELSKSLGETGALVGKLRTDLDEMRNQPAGRMSVTTPGAGGDMNKSLENGGTGGQLEGMKPREFLAKCLSMHKTGALSLQDVTMAEAAINSNMEVPANIRTKVFSSK